MESTDHSTERRRQKRLVPRTLAFASLSSGVEKLGRIKNINKVGLAFEYLSYDRRDPQVNEGELVLFMRDGEICIEHISCTLIYDVGVPRENPVFIRPFEERRCGVKFHRLTKEKSRQLESFLNKYTVDPENPSEDEMPV